MDEVERLESENEELNNRIARLHSEAKEMRELLNGQQSIIETLTDTIHIFTVAMNDAKATAKKPAPRKRVRKKPAPPSEAT